MDFDIVVVGAGQAGFQLAASLRQQEFSGSILMLGDEPGLPYQRPPLSKAFLKEGDGDRLRFRDEAFFADNAIELETGRRVAAIDRHGAAVLLDDGRRVGYGHLVLATGAANRRPPIEGVDLEGVVGLRTLGDAQRLRAALAGTSRLVVIGGGFIGLEVAATARAMGVEVTVLEATDRLMSRVVSRPVSAHFLGLHRDAGIDVRLDTMAARIVGGGDGRVTGVELPGGTLLEAGLVLVAAGVVANDGLAEAAGLYVHDGIRVDDRLATEDPAISAIGDCASFPFGHDGIQTRLESVQNAVDQARCLARRLVGRPARYAALPWFWSDQGPAKLQIAGLALGADHHETIGGEGRLTVQCFRRGELIGVETVNAPGDHMAARRLMETGRPVTLEDARRAGFDLSGLYRARKAEVQ